VFFVLGFVCLALAIVTRQAFEHSTAIPESHRDTAAGALFGAAFGCLIIAMWKDATTGDEPGTDSSE
jgi:hypothetical protein